MDFNYIEEVAPLTEEEWEHIISWHRKRFKLIAVEGLLAAKQFCDGIDEIHRMAGHSQEEIGEVSQAILDMAHEEVGE